MIFKRKKKKLENFNALGLINDIAFPLTPFGEKITNSDVVLICIVRITSQCAKLKGRALKDKEYLLKPLLKNAEELINFLSSYQINDNEKLVLILDGADFDLTYQLGIKEFNKLINKILTEKKIMLILTSQGREFLTKENSNLFNIKINKTQNKDNGIIINKDGYTYSIIRFEVFR